MEKSRKAVAYCRVSSKEQAEGFSLKSQEEACRRFAASHGFELVRVFANPEGESAKTADRPELKELIKHVSKSKERPSAVIVWKFDRLARNMNDYTDLLNFFIRAGIEVLSVTEPADQSSAGKLMVNIFGSFAQFENDVRAERTSAGMKQAVKEGRWVWRPPVGFSMQKDPLGKHVLVQNERANHIRLAFELAADPSETQIGIIKKLKRQGFQLSPQTLNRVLRNQIYAGLIFKAGWLDEPIRGLHQPIVSMELFTKVQRTLNKERASGRPRMSKNPEFPLRNLVKCSECGAPMTGSFSRGRSGRRYPYYHLKDCKCGRGSIRRDAVHALFVSVLSSIQPTQRTLRLFRAIMADAIEEKGTAVSNHRGDLSSQVKKWEEKKTRALNFLLNGSILEEDYQQVAAEARSHILSLQDDLRGLEGDYSTVEGCIDTCCDRLACLADTWLTGDNDLRLRFQRFLFPLGIAFDGDSFRTIESPLLINILSPKESEESYLVTPTGVEPVLPP